MLKHQCTLKASDLCVERQLVFTFSPLKPTAGCEDTPEERRAGHRRRRTSPGAAGSVPKTWQNRKPREPRGKYVSFCSGRVLARRHEFLSVSLNITSGSVLLLLQIYSECNRFICSKFLLAKVAGSPPEGSTIA